MAVTRMNELRPGTAAEWVDPTEEQALVDDVTSRLSQLPSAIDSPETYQRAKASLPLLKQAEDKVVGFFRDIKEAANRAHKVITTKESAQLSPIRAARQRISSLIYGYEQQLERARLAREQQARDEAKRAAESAALETAQALSDQGAPEMAEQVLVEATLAPAPVVQLPSQSVEVSGVSTRENWTYLYAGGSPGQRWKDLSDDQRKRALALIPREYLIPDEVAIGRVVKAMKSSTRIPGIQAFDAGTVVVRA